MIWNAAKTRKRKWILRMGKRGMKSTENVVAVEVIEMEKVLVGLVVLLVLLSGIQAYAAVKLKSVVSEMKVSSLRAPPTSGSGVSVPSNLQNLPQMVGGC